MQKIERLEQAINGERKGEVCRGRGEEHAGFQGKFFRKQSSSSNQQNQQGTNMIELLFLLLVFLYSLYEGMITCKLAKQQGEPDP